MRDRELFKIIVCQNSKVGWVIDRYNAGAGFTNTRGVFSGFVHLKPVRVVLVIANADIFFPEACRQSLD